MPINPNDVRDYYAPAALKERVKSALSAIGKPFDELTIEDIAVVDEFHIRGEAATNELIAATDFSSDSKILDLGCGLGGPARRLASKTNCKVTGIDLSDEFIDCANYLTELVKLEDLVSFKACSCLELPFEDASFDGAWTIQMMMNIDQKQALLNEVKRVLKPGAKFVIYEVMAGDNQAPYFPVPWAQSADNSCLCSQAELKTLLAASGFEIETWVDKTDLARQAFAGMSPPSSDSKLPPLGVHFLVGDDILTKAYNLKRNLNEGRVTLVQAVTLNN